ncbi:hypothetical protein [Thiomicrorhabdus aquaedulcis]|uniref:hypothetical protein n=1 Tax=Thiomicrorhabdus aquaedulcis TaxID=2211106 RepID=UPI000FDAA359|nr:hypothetical protein [Thiomicrorhabdus aquaedulcis]
MKLTLLATALSSLTLAGCGGGGGSSTPPPPADTSSTGTFIDSAVAGVAYKTATKSGTTSDKGEYKYEAGETVTFSIGGVSFPPVLAKGVVTPFDMAGSQDVDNQQVLNIGLLLQTLDEDKNPSNGIKITPAVVAALANTTLTAADFSTADTASFQSKFSGVLLDSSAIAWKNEQDVKDHLANANGIVGTWMKTGSIEDGLTFIKFEVDGQYLLLSDEKFKAEDVLQVGNYVVNSTDKTITFTRTYGDESTTLESLPLDLELSDDLLGFKIDGSVDFARTVSLAAQVAEPDAINGVWVFDKGETGISETKLLAFNKDNTYFVFSLEGSESGDNSGLPDGAVVYEKGTYTLGENGAFLFNVTENKDGDKGLGLASSISYTVSEAGVLTLTIATSDSGSGDYTLQKLLPFEIQK